MRRLSTMQKRNTKALLLAGAVVAAAVGLVLSTNAPNADILPAPDRHAPPVQPGQGACPAGASDSGWGPDMVRLPENFCIDTTEVSRGQYADWLDTSPSTSGQSSACTDNDEFTPSCDWEPGSDENLPVVCVDWCDAKAFCDAAGKRLCGRIGDGAEYSVKSYDDASVSEWHAACTSGGLYDYPYGDDLDTSICRGADAEDIATWGVGDVGSFGDCHAADTPYSEVYDLSGNAAEWDNACDGAEPDDPCRIRGGSFQHHAHGLRCAMARDLRWPRMRKVQAVGFRCCAD